MSAETLTTASEMLKITNEAKTKKEVDSLLKEVLAACRREAHFGNSFAAIATYALNQNPAAYEGLLVKLKELGYTCFEGPYVFLDGQIRSALRVSWYNV